MLGKGAAMHAWLHATALPCAACCLGSLSGCLQSLHDMQQCQLQGPHHTARGLVTVDSVQLPQGSAIRPATDLAG